MSRNKSMSERFFLDPLEGEKEYPEEPIYNYYIGLLPQGAIEYEIDPGRTEFSPKDNLIVGSRYDFTIKYFPGNKVIPANSVIAFSIPRTWTQPHEESQKPGYVTAEISNKGKVSLEFSHNNNLQWWIKINIGDLPMIEGNFVTVKYSEVKIQRFPQNWFGNWRSAMRTVVDYEGEGEFSCVSEEKTEKPTIIAAPPAKLYVAMPSVIRPNEVFIVKASVLDYCNNRAYPSSEGLFFLTSETEPFIPLTTAQIDEKNNNYLEFKITTPTSCDSFNVIAANKKNNLYGKGAPSIIDHKGDKLNVYFGDTHAKTMLSDGLKTPMKYFEHARDVALLDFAAIADHNFMEASRIEGPFRKQMSDEGFAEIQSACESYNESGRFVTLQSFEQNRIKGYPGHRNVYFKGIAPGLFRGEKLKDLYKYLEGHDALIIPHHPIIWNTKIHLNNSKYERVLEMYSMHCSSEFKGSSINNYETTKNKKESGISAREILDNGFRIGFIASSDNHNGAPGLSAVPSRFTNLTYPGGLAAVLAPDLTRESIFDGLYNRRCYATSGVRIYLDFRINGELMGSEIKIEIPSKVKYEITISGTDKIASIELIRNSKPEKIWDFNGQNVIQLSGEITIDCPEHIYLKVTQIDRHMAWSTAIWIDKKK
jgi:uncharacterized protein DUF3604